LNSEIHEEKEGQRSQNVSHNGKFRYTKLPVSILSVQMNAANGPKNTVNGAKLSAKPLNFVT
jgi:hypothetical protein